jgi:integrase
VDRAEAEAFVVRLKSNSSDHAAENQRPCEPVWHEAVARYVNECAEKKSLPDDRDHLRKLEPYLRTRKLEAIDMTALHFFIRDRKEKDNVANATVNRALEIVRRILNLAHRDWRWIRAVPKIRMLKEPRRRVRFLRRDEATRLIAALPAHIKPMVRFALATSCRAGEILGLEWNRVDLPRRIA